MNELYPLWVDYIGRNDEEVCATSRTNVPGWRGYTHTMGSDSPPATIDRRQDTIKLTFTELSQGRKRNVQAISARNCDYQLDCFIH